MLGERIPFYDPVARIAFLDDRNEIQLVVSAFTFTTIFLVFSTFEHKEVVKEKIKKFRILAAPADLTDKEIKRFYPPIFLISRMLFKTTVHFRKIAEF